MCGKQSICIHIKIVVHNNYKQLQQSIPSYVFTCTLNNTIVGFCCNSFSSYDFAILYEERLQQDQVYLGLFHILSSCLLFLATHNGMSQLRKYPMFQHVELKSLHPHIDASFLEVHLYRTLVILFFFQPFCLHSLQHNTIIIHSLI